MVHRGQDDPALAQHQSSNVRRWWARRQPDPPTTGGPAGQALLFQGSGSLVGSGRGGLKSWNGPTYQVAFSARSDAPLRGPARQLEKGQQLGSGPDLGPRPQDSSPALASTCPLGAFTEETLSIGTVRQPSNEPVAL